MRPHLPRSTPVVVLVAVACLMIGSAGGAVAGSLITGKQIKNGTVTGVDIKDRSLSARDLSRPAVSSLRGHTGAQGPRGLNAWDTIPSGKTVTGRFYDTGARSSVTDNQVTNIEFPAKAPVAPTGYGFGPDDFSDPGDTKTSTDPACTGTFSQPTAPAGHVCVYLGGMSGLNNSNVSGWDDPAQNPYTFFVGFQDADAEGSYYYWGSWAYTAP